MFTIKRPNLILEFFRSGGPGGQKQNKTSSACRISHPESGAVGECREERHQHTNRRRALERLVAHPKFKAWVRLKAAALALGYQTIQAKIDQLLHPKNLKVERLITFTCDDCGRKEVFAYADGTYDPERIATGAGLPVAWCFVPPDNHYCPGCRRLREVQR